MYWSWGLRHFEEKLSMAVVVKKGDSGVVGFEEEVLGCCGDGEG